MLPPLEAIAKVAAALEVVPYRFVFAGAAIRPLLFDESFPEELRLTHDTDLVVSVVSYGEWIVLREMLVQAGFVERADQTTRRQILFFLGDIRVDFIPAMMQEFGTANRWLALGFEEAEIHELADGRTILCLPVAAWLAAKIAAFEGRGRADPLVSNDLEDIVLVLAGCSRLIEALSLAPIEIRNFVQSSFKAWRKQPIVWQAMEDMCVGKAWAGTMQRIRLRLSERVGFK